MVQQDVLSTSQLSDAFFCAICFNTFKKPKILPSCCHCFCYICIQSWYKCDGAATGILKCPVCRRSVNWKQRKPRKSVIATCVRCFFRKIPEYDHLSCYLDDCLTAKLAAKLRSRNLTKEGIPSPSQDHFLRVTLRKQHEHNLNKVSAKKRDFHASKSLLIVKERLTCQICKFILDDPRMLPGCQHSFCLSCLQMEFKQNGSEKGIINCVSCDKAYRLDKILRSNCNNVTPTSINGSQMSSVVQLATVLPFDYVLSVLLENFREHCTLF